MTGGGWAEWSESQAGAAAATPRTTEEGGAAAGAALEEAWAAMGVVVTVAEAQKALAGWLQWASPPASVGSGLFEKVLAELRSLQAAPDVALGV